MIINSKATKNQLQRLIRHSTNTKGFFSTTSDIKKWGKSYFNLENFKLNRSVNELCCDLIPLVQRLEDNLTNTSPIEKTTFQELKKIYKIDPNNHEYIKFAAKLMVDIFNDKDKADILNKNQDLKILTFCVFKNMALKVQHKYFKVFNRPNNNLGLALDKAFNNTKQEIRNNINTIRKISNDSKHEIGEFNISTKSIDKSKLEDNFKEGAKKSAIKYGEKLNKRLNELNSKLDYMNISSDDHLNTLCSKMERFSNNQLNNIIFNIDNTIKILDFISSYWGNLVHDSNILAKNDLDIIHNRLKIIKNSHKEDEINENEVSDLITKANDLIKRSFFYDENNKKLASVMQELQVNPLMVPVLLIQDINIKLNNILIDIKNKQLHNRQLIEEIKNLSNASNHDIKLNILDKIKVILDELELNTSDNNLKNELDKCYDQVNIVNSTALLIKKYTEKKDYLTQQINIIDFEDSIDQGIIQSKQIIEDFVKSEEQILEFERTISLALAYQKDIDIESNVSRSDILRDSYNSVAQSINKNLSDLGFFNKTVNSEDVVSRIDTKKSLTESIKRLSIKKRSPSLQSASSHARKSSEALIYAMNHLNDYAKTLDLNLPNIMEILSIDEANKFNLTVKQQIQLVGYLLDGLANISNNASIIATPMIIAMKKDHNINIHKYQDKAETRVKHVNNGLVNTETIDSLAPLLKFSIFELMASDKYLKVDKLIKSKQKFKAIFNKMLPEEINLNRALFKWYSYLKGNNKHHHRTFYIESRKLFNLIMLYRYIDSISLEEELEPNDNNPPAYNTLFKDDSQDLLLLDPLTSKDPLPNLIENIWINPQDKDNTIKKIARFIVQKPKGKSKDTEMSLILRALFGYNKDTLAIQLENLAQMAKLDKFSSTNTQGMSVSHSMVRNLLKASMKNEGNLTKNSEDVRLLLDLLTNYTEVEQI